MINYCQLSPCGDGGSCVPEVGGYDCSCHPGYSVERTSDGETCTGREYKILSRHSKRGVRITEVLITKVRSVPFGREWDFRC